ncbi:TPA: hypothetical protein R4Y39_000465 [Raoultella planticola]|nr:hypothetical protein [Raoultella planticola]
MTNNQLTDKRLAQLAKRNFCQTRGEEYTPFGDEVVSMAAELQERRKIEREPVAEVLSSRPGNDTSVIDSALPVGTTLYRHTQPAPVVPDGLLSMAASAIEDLLEHTDPNTSYYSGVWADVPGKLRAAMIAAAPQEVK